MINIKRKSLFFRTFYISSVVVFCLFFGIYGTVKAYESIRLVAFGEYRKAIGIEKDSIKIFDFEINF